MQLDVKRCHFIPFPKDFLETLGDRTGGVDGVVGVPDKETGPLGLATGRADNLSSPRPNLLSRFAQRYTALHIFHRERLKKRDDRSAPDEMHSLERVDKQSRSGVERAKVCC